MRDHFDVKKIDEYYKKIIDTFKSHFLDFGYIEHESFPIISSRDRSVRFIGSTTNVFKEYILNGRIPNRGFFLVQKCLRTQNAKTFLNDEIFPEWSSYFTAIGSVCPKEGLEKLAIDTLSFLFKLGIRKERLQINVSSKDEDLLIIAKNLSREIKISVDGKTDIGYYRHKYGVEELGGRNFNIAIENKRSGEYKDIGNVLIIEKNGIAIAGEMGIGVGTLLSRMYSLTNSIESSVVSKVVPFQLGMRSKFSDALSASVILLNEKIRPGSRDKERILRIYLEALAYLGKKLYYSSDDIAQYAGEYELAEFGRITDISEQVEKYMESLR